MMYRVELIQTVYEGASVYIEADNPERAEELALRKANGLSEEGNVRWKFVDTHGDIEVTEVAEHYGLPL